MKLLNLLIVAAVFCVLTPALKAQDKPRTEEDALLIRIATLNIMNLPIGDALAKVTELSKENDPSKKGISIILAPGIDPSKIKPVSLTLKDVPVFDVIRVIAALSKLEAKYGETMVQLVEPAAAPKP